MHPYLPLIYFDSLILMARPPFSHYNNVLRCATILVTLACATLTWASLIYAAPLPKGVDLSFTNFSNVSSSLNCSIDGLTASNTNISPDNICKVFITGKSVIFSAPVYPTSARYQYLKKVQLWSSKTKSHAVSFSTSYVIEFLRSSDRRESENFFSFGGGWAFAITPDQRVGAAGPESLGLFEIDPKTGNSLRGKKKTKTLAVELDISRNSGDVTFPDPSIPHVGLDIDTVRSVVTSPIGSFPTLVDRPIAVFIDYDALKARLDVRVQKLSGSDTSRSVPDKKKAKLYISYAPLRLSDLVEEYSYVGFSSRVPVEEHGNYFLTSWKFSTKWVDIDHA